MTLSQMVTSIVFSVLFAVAVVLAVKVSLRGFHTQLIEETRAAHPTR